MRPGVAKSVDLLLERADLRLARFDLLLSCLERLRLELEEGADGRIESGGTAGERDDLQANRLT